MSQWYAIQVNTQRASKVAASLAELGFSTFTPHERVIRRAGRYTEPRDQPMYPGYLFVLCEESSHDDETDFTKVRRVGGVVGFVSYMERGIPVPMAFPLAMIIEIQAEERAGFYDRTRAKPNVYRPRKGDRVQITAGKWMAYFAKVISTPRGQRAHLKIEGPYGRGDTVDIAHLKAA